MDNRNSRAAGYPGMDADELARLQRLTGGTFPPGRPMPPAPAAGTMSGQMAYGMPIPASPASPPTGGQVGVSPSAVLSDMASGPTGNAAGTQTGTEAANTGINQPMNPMAGMLPMQNMFPMNGMFPEPNAVPTVAAPAESAALGNQPAARLSPTADTRAPAAPVATARTPAAGVSSPDAAADADMQDFMAQGYLMGPNCFGRDARVYAERLMEYINDEYKDNLTYLALARKAPTARARTILRNIARDEMRHARRWAAAYFLITGKRYFPERGSVEVPPIASYSQTLRERYLAESRDAVKYRQFARETTDRCLQRLAMEISDDERQHAQHILELIQDQYR